MAVNRTAPRGAPWAAAPTRRGRAGRYHPRPVARLPIPRRFKNPRDIPWQLVLTVAVQIGREGSKRWNRLSERERGEVVRIMKKSKARWSNLSEGERRDLREIVFKALGPEHR
jgi:hypothetical protein